MDGPTGTESQYCHQQQSVHVSLPLLTVPAFKAECDFGRAMG